MENVSFSTISKTLDTLEKSKKPDLSTVAELVQAAKLASDRASEYWTKVKAFCIDRKIDHAESDTVEINISARAGSMRYDAKKLDAYFLSKNVDTTQFKSEIAGSNVVTIKAK